MHLSATFGVIVVRRDSKRCCVAVIGAGSFGTALAWMLKEAGHDVRMWCYEKSDADYINAAGRNPLFLSTLRLDGVRATNVVAKAVEGADAVIVVTPSFAVRAVARKLAACLLEDIPVAVLSKGLDATSGTTLYETVAELLGNEGRLCEIAGPNHAEEIAQGSYAGAVAASTNMETARFFQNLLSRKTFRIYTAGDPVGVGLCAASKNVIAIACGMARGMGQGDNTISLLMTRGLAEISRLVVACGGEAATCLGLAGVGDLNTTCNSRHSRNGSYGEVFAREGISVAEYEERCGMVVEGAHSLDALLALGAAKGVELPIMQAVRDLLDGKVSLAEAADYLMGRTLKAE